MQLVRVERYLHQFTSEETMNLNWWRVGAITLFASSLLGLAAGFFLDNNVMLWALASLLSYILVRLEWVISGLITAAKGYEPETNPYD